MRFRLTKAHNEGGILSLRGACFEASRRRAGLRGVTLSTAAMAGARGALAQATRTASAVAQSTRTTSIGVVPLVRLDVARVLHLGIHAVATHRQVHVRVRKLVRELRERSQRRVVLGAIFLLRARRSLTTTVFRTFLSTTLSDNNFVPKGWHDSVNDGGHSGGPALGRRRREPGACFPKMSSLKNALWSSVDVRHRRAKARWRMIPTRSRLRGRTPCRLERHRKHLKTSRSMTSLSLWGSAQKQYRRPARTATSRPA